MSPLLAALWAEALKARRSRVPLVTAAALSVFPIVGGLFMIIMKDPERAREMGLIGAKAQLLSGGPADWKSYFEFLSMGTAMGGAVLFAFITAWVFGREFSDHTAKELLAVPTRREVIVGAKFLLTAVWILALTVLIYLIGLATGMAIGLPGWSAQLAWTAFFGLMITVLLTTMQMPLVAWFASVGRGYLPPLGWAFGTLALAQVAGVMGWGDWFPWSVPGVFSMTFSLMYGEQAEQIGLHSYVLVLLTFIAGMAATFAWWRRADQSR
jgi:ABC-2 type transport system permease protein